MQLAHGTKVLPPEAARLVSSLPGDAQTRQFGLGLNSFESSVRMYWLALEIFVSVGRSAVLWADQIHHVAEGIRVIHPEGGEVGRCWHASPCKTENILSWFHLRFHLAYPLPQGCCKYINQDRKVRFAKSRFNHRIQSTRTSRTCSCLIPRLKQTPD